MAVKGKSNNGKNIKAIYSVICLCVIALGLIVYFSTQTEKSSGVNEPTTVRVEETTEVQRRVTVKEEAKEPETQQSTEAETSEPETTTEAKTEPATMPMNETNTPYKSFYKYPVSEEVLAGYSEELVKNETMGDYRAHMAVDFRAGAGVKVVAINDGIVTAVTKNPLYGNIVEIDHGGKLTARYCGLETVGVKEGDSVTIGQAVGTVGAVPFEGGLDSHLHFETLIDGQYVNPLDVMGKTE